jgi:hypothetical protein
MSWARRLHRHSYGLGSVRSLTLTRRVGAAQGPGPSAGAAGKSRSEPVPGAGGLQLASEVVTGVTSSSIVKYHRHCIRVPARGPGRRVFRLQVSLTRQ